MEFNISGYTFILNKPRAIDKSNSMEKWMVEWMHLIESNPKRIRRERELKLKRIMKKSDKNNI